MAIKVVEHSQAYSSAVAAFNKRMHDGGSKWGFYIDPTPDWIPRQPGSKTWREYHLAVEDETEVRGGYALKPQQWLIYGREAWVTDWQGPFTEAAIDVNYSPLMLRLFRHMQKDHPLLFSLGHGGTEEPIVDFLRKMKWHLWSIPFSFHVIRPFQFLRKNNYLRTSTVRRALLDCAAFSGLGWMAIKLSQWAIRSAAERVQTAKAEVVAEFGAWTDDLWHQAKEQYTCLAVRDSAMMNALMPQSGWPGGTRLRIRDQTGATIGWSIVHSAQMEDDTRFGDMNVGLITDSFARIEDAGAVLRATHEYLSSQSVDMIFANMSHKAWINGLKSSGYVTLADRRVFAFAPALYAALEPHEQARQGLHLTNMDGHGPHGFYSESE